MKICIKAALYDYFFSVLNFLVRYFFSYYLEHKKINDFLSYFVFERGCFPKHIIHLYVDLDLKFVEKNANYIKSLKYYSYFRIDTLMGLSISRSISLDFIWVSTLASFYIYIGNRQNLLGFLLALIGWNIATIVKVQNTLLYSKIGFPLIELHHKFI